jgi:hypothetical protein
MLGLGPTLMLITIPLWIDGFDLDESPDNRAMSADDTVDIITAGTMAGIGVGMLITGAILLPVGLAQRAAAKRRANIFTFTPQFSITPRGASLGFALAF